MPTQPKPILFVGPTAFGLPARLRLRLEQDYELRGPVRRGDLPRLVRERPPGVVVLVDGAFHQHLAVGHAEIRESVGLGWTVWGLSSIGAIRAYEMRGMGVKGFGRVFRMFCDGDDFQDDEVALLHEPDPPYRPFTEPLVHLRAILAFLLSRTLITPGWHDRCVAALKQDWYGERGIERFEAMVRPVVGHAVYRRTIPDYGRFRLKTRDLAAFIRLRAWDVTAAGCWADGQRRAGGPPAAACERLTRNAPFGGNPLPPP